MGKTKLPQEFFKIDYAELGKRSIRTLFYVQQRIELLNEKLEEDEHQSHLRSEREILKWVLAQYAIKPRDVPEIEAVGLWPHIGTEG